MTYGVKVDPKGHLNLLIMLSHVEDPPHPMDIDRIWQDLCRLEMVATKEQMAFPPISSMGKISLI